jgi:hypothetical protein
VEPLFVESFRRGYARDIQAGRIAATTIAAAIMNQPELQRDFAVANVEMRKVLGYGK